MMQRLLHTEKLTCLLLCMQYRDHVLEAENRRGCRKSKLPFIETNKFNSLGSREHYKENEAKLHDTNELPVESDFNREETNAYPN